MDDGGLEGVKSFRPHCFTRPPITSTNKNNDTNTTIMRNTNTNDTTITTTTNNNNNNIYINNDYNNSNNIDSLPYLALDCGSASSRLIMERLKIFSDGSLGAETAAISRDTDIDIDRDGINSKDNNNNNNNNKDIIIEKSISQDNGSNNDNEIDRYIGKDKYDGVLYHTPDSMSGIYLSNSLYI
jgi:hypothetical protein